MSAKDVFGEVISSYSRSQAIEDGVLVDMTDYTTDGFQRNRYGGASTLVRQAGFKYPLAVTRAVYDRLIILPDNYHGYQDVTGRFWDILTCLWNAIKRSDAYYDRVSFGVYVRAVNNNGSDAHQPKLEQLKAILGSGDNGELVFTVMFPEED